MDSDDWIDVFECVATGSLHRPVRGKPTADNDSWWTTVISVREALKHIDPSEARLLVLHFGYGEPLNRYVAVSLKTALIHLVEQLKGHQQ